MVLGRPVSPLVLLLLAACHGAPTAPAAIPTLPRATFRDGLVAVGAGRSLHIDCAGTGTPVVVLEAGLGDDGRAWNLVQPELSHSTQTCVYDRAGTGYSDAAPTHHTVRQMVDELHALLTKAEIGAPYVLVGHSIGGLNVRLYASEHRADVVGMVLVDATSEYQDARLWTLLPEQGLRAFEAGLRSNPEGLDLDAYRASLAQVRASSRALGDVPLVVLTRGKESPPPPGISPELDARMAKAWREMQSELPSLSTNSAQVIAENSGHYIHGDAPALVVASVREVLQAVRAHARVDAHRLEVLGKGTH